jgi:exodeoxyribonuclease V gamma subunit
LVRLVYSNRTEELVTELAARVRVQQEGDAVLDAVPVVVPNAAVEEYMRTGVARSCGIAANLRATLVTRFVGDFVAQSTPSRVAGADAFEAMGLTLLLDPSFVAHSELAPVREYLGAGRSTDAANVRRVQLASRIGRLFEQYTFSRSEMLAAWAHGPVFVGRGAEPEQWQRRMWLAMFGKGGLAPARGLVALHDAVAAMSNTASSASPPPAPVHVFGFPHFARVFHEFFAALSRTRDVVVYSLSPCEGFWEDFDPRDPAPLRLWGRPGREHVRALDALAGFDHDDRFAEPAGDTLLAELQRDVLRRVPAREAPAEGLAFERDESIVVLECASVRREMEAVASEIWRLLEADPTLCFDEIAVLLPDPDAHLYLAHLPIVFREAHDIPHQVLDVPLAAETPVVEAIDLLLALPLGRFTRQELLRLAVHPAVVAALGEVDPARWVGWCDDLGIVHGADRGDHQDTYIERDILNWDQGLRRLALGVFMAGDASGERRCFELAGEGYLPQELGADDMEDAAALGLLVRSLMADARFVRDATLTMKEWAEVLCDLVATYVAPTGDAEAEPLVGCLRRLHALGETDVGGAAVPYRVACELARERVASWSNFPRREGVVVSRLGSTRPIPFRVVFACGMGEGRFPSPDADDPLDLRWARREQGDVTARERDKYAFLELLIGTRDRLYLSYVSRDPLTGDSLESSSVVQELLHALSRGYVRDATSLRRHHPLRRWDPRYFPALFGGGGDPAPPLGTMRMSEAAAEATTLALRRDLDAHDEPVDRDGLERRAEGDPAWAALSEHLRIGRLPAVAPRADARVAVPMYALVKFLELAIQGWARFGVGLDEQEDEDVLAREDEPFETVARDETMLLRRIFLSPTARLSIERAYDDEVHERELRGTGPSGVFAAGERWGHLRTLESWKAQLEAIGVPIETICTHRFGRAGEHATADRVHPALVLDVDVEDAAGVTKVLRAEIGGRTLPLADDARVSVTLARYGGDEQDEWAVADRRRAALRAFVDHAVLSASGVADGRTHASFTATPPDAQPDRVSFEPLSASEALVWLRGLVRELLGGPHAYFLPCEAVFVHRRLQAGAPLVPCVQVARDMLRDGDGPPALRSAYGPVPRPHEYPIPEEDVARAMVARRFGVLFEKWREPW